MAPRGTTVLGVCVNIGSMLAPSWVPRNQPAHGRRVDAARGCKRRSAHARKGMDRTVGDAQVADKELPGTRGPTFASFFQTCMIMVEVSITRARGDEQRQLAFHLALLRDALGFERAAFVGESIGAPGPLPRAR